MLRTAMEPNLTREQQHSYFVFGGQSAVHNVVSRCLMRKRILAGTGTSQGRAAAIAAALEMNAGSSS
jgi:hypothetical protein